MDLRGAGAEEQARGRRELAGDRGHGGDSTRAACRGRERRPFGPETAGDHLRNAKRAPMRTDRTEALLPPSGPTPRTSSYRARTSPVDGAEPTLPEHSVQRLLDVMILDRLAQRRLDRVGVRLRVEQPADPLDQVCLQVVGLLLACRLDSHRRHTTSHRPLNEPESELVLLDRGFAGQPQVLGRWQKTETASSPKAEENNDRAVQTHHILVCEPSDTRPEFGLRYGRNLVHHQPGDHPEPVRLAGFDGGTEERSIGRIARESADGDGARCAEPIILNDDDRPRFAGIVLTAGSGPHLTALHSSTPAEMVSMKA